MTSPIGEVPGELRQTTFVEALAVSGDGRFVVTGDDKRAVRLFDTVNGGCWERKSPVQVRRRREVRRIAVSADGTTIAVQYHNLVWILDTAAFDTTPGTLIPDMGQFGLALSPDGRTLAGSHVWGVTLADIATGTRRPIRTGDDAAAYGIDFSPDGTLLAGAYRIREGAQRLRFLDTVTGAVRAEVEVADQDDLFWSALAVRRDGSVMVVTGKPVLLEWDGYSAKVHRRPVEVPGADPDWPTTRLLPPINALAVCLLHNSTALVDLSSGKIGHELPGRRRHLAVTPDGRTLATSNGVTVDLYDGATLEPRTPGAGLSTFVTTVAFEAGGDALWTADLTFGPALDASRCSARRDPEDGRNRPAADPRRHRRAGLRQAQRLGGVPALGRAAGQTCRGGTPHGWPVSGREACRQRRRGSRRRTAVGHHDRPGRQ